MGKNDCCFAEEGWSEGIFWLTTAFQTAVVLSYGLSLRDLENMADYCSLLSHCFRSLAISERKWCKD